ncbi:MAG: efflux RND transporter periplasmic adaptor subunit, partial [bacterium]
GVVGKIVPTADRAKATVMTKIKFVQRDERVLPEMSAKVTFLSKASSESVMNSAKKIAVSPAAIVTRGDQKIVFVVRDGSVTETPVEIAGTLGSMLEVRSGLVEGNQVVLNPSENMATGTKVKLALK